jgi:hypothetical protein
MLVGVRRAFFSFLCHRAHPRPPFFSADLAGRFFSTEPHGRKNESSRSSLIMQAYDHLVASGVLTHDLRQRTVIHQLERLQRQLCVLQDETTAQQSSLWSIVRRKPSPPPGLYLHGDVGNGHRSDIPICIYQGFRMRKNIFNESIFRVVRL